jgi:methionyl-tRNA formyltransferase
MTALRVAFAGTPAFAAAALGAIHGAGHPLVLVLTQPDRPAGRGLKRQASAVKQLALQHGLPVAQPQGLKLDGRFAADAQAAREALLAARPDVMVVAAYGLILPPWLLALPRLGCLNIHASLLPRWRGAAPIQRALLAGDLESGISIMQMDAGLDTGPVLLQRRVPVTPDDDAGTLHDKLAALGADAIAVALADLDAGRARATPQPQDGATYARKIEKGENRLDWTRPAAELERKVRAFRPAPGAVTALGGDALKVWRTRVVEGRGEPGSLIAAQDELVVACGERALAIKELQRAGGRALSAAEFLRGHPLPDGARFT